MFFLQMQRHLLFTMKKMKRVTSSAWQHHWNRRAKRRCWMDGAFTLLATCSLTVTFLQVLKRFSLKGNEDSVELLLYVRNQMIVYIFRCGYMLWWTGM